MIEFYEYWSALFRMPLIGWTIGAQLLAATTVVALNFVSWQARRYVLICVPLGGLSWLILSVPLLILGWILGGWSDWDKSAPPAFVDLTWLYFAGLEIAIILLALGTAFLHRKQFALPFPEGLFGFFFDMLLNASIFACLNFTFIPLVIKYVGFPFVDRFLVFFLLNGLVLWLFFLWMRPTMLGALRRLKLARHPKTHGLT